MKNDYLYHLYTALSYENKRLKKEIELYKSDEKYIKIQDDYSKLMKKYIFSCEENKKKDITIADLKKDIEEFGRQLEDMKDDIILNEALKKELEYYKKELNNSKEKLKSIISEKEKLNNEIEKLKEINKKYKKKAYMNSSNSSYSSSYDKVDNKPVNSYNSRTKSDKKVGGQLGHDHHPRKEIEVSNNVNITDINNDNYENNPRYRKTGKSKEKTLIDILLSPIIKIFRIYEYYDTVNKVYVWSKYPQELKDEISYGNNLKTLIIYLSVKCNMSIKNIQEFIYSASNNQINISTGFISNLIKNTSKLIKEDINEIENKLLLSDCCHFDLTNCNINGENKNILNLVSNNASLYYLKETKSQKDLDDSLLLLLDKTVIHDHVVGFYKYGNEHQECLAHVIRYLKQAKELENNISWHTNMLNLITKIIDLKKNKTEIIYEEISKEYDEIIKIGKEEYEKIEIPKYITEGKTLLKRMEKYKDNHLLFLKQDIPYTNNICERMLRGFKRKQKQAIVFRSKANVESLCLILSIINTAKLNNINPYFKILEIFNRNTSIPN